MNFPYYILIAGVMLLFLGACQKFDDSLRIEEDPITLAKRQFEKDSMAFVLSGLKSQNEVWSRGKRTVEWSKARVGGDSSFLVPVRVEAAKDSVIRLVGELPINGNLWLYAKETGSGYTFTLWTLIPDMDSGSDRFSGVVFSEDYFRGNTSYSLYNQGEAIRDSGTRARVNQRMASRERRSGLKSQTTTWECNTYHINFCAYGANGDVGCGVIEKTTCQWVRSGTPGFGDNEEVISWIDCDPLEGGCGSGGDVVIEEAYETIDSLYAYPCAQKIRKDLEKTTRFGALIKPFQVPAGTAVPQLIWTHKDMVWNNDNDGNYMFGTASAVPLHNNAFNRKVTIALNTQLLEQSSDLMVAAIMFHEAIHAYATYYVKTQHITTVPTIDGYIHQEAMDKSWIFMYLQAMDFKEGRGINRNYTDHAAMMGPVFSQIIMGLKAWGGNRYTAREYELAALIGLDNPGGGFNDGAPNPTPEQEADIQNLFNALLVQFGVTEAELISFITDHNNGSKKTPCTD